MAFSLKEIKPVNGRWNDLFCKDLSNSHFKHFIPINQEQYTELTLTDSDFFSDSDTFYTYGVRDASYVLIPLDQEDTHKLIQIQNN
jgi:hypothetical protein